MNGDDQDLLDLAGRVSDGAAIDWEAAERGAATKPERHVVRHLRLVEDLARVCREAPVVKLPDPQALASTISASFLRRLETPAGPTLPARWGRLELRELLGRGAFGAVYRAWDDTLQQEVALKLLDARADDPRRVEQFLEEARSLARLRHPNVVSVHNAEVHDQQVGIWMELVRGQTLGELLEDKGRFGAQEATLIGLELCRALAAVHGAGLVHRDVKAGNVMRAEGGRTVLMDFGATSDLAGRDASGDRRLSGTPLYMAPELFSSGSATIRSDVYALGVLLYHLVTGHLPIEARSFDELKEKHRTGDVRRLRDARPDLPEGFVRVVERALGPAPEARYSSAGELEQALSATLGVEVPDVPRQVVSGPQERKPRMTLVVAAVVLVAGVVAVVAWLGGSKAPVGGAEYEVSATLERQAPGDSEPRPVDSGAMLALGDLLTLRIRASAPLYVYVFNEDARGNSFALFPLPHLELQNPLPARATHVLPGPGSGQDLAWVVNVSGERERLVILASPERQVEFEAELARLPEARPGQIALPLTDGARRALRGIGGLAARPAPSGPVSAAPLFEMARRLAGGTERVQGVWLRQLELRNPAP